MAAQIHDIREPYVRRLRAAMTALKKNEEDWPARVMELALCLHAARQEYPSNETFGRWLDDQGFDDLNRMDRAALLNLAQHETLARETLAKTERRSIQLIWREEVQPTLSSHSTMTASSPEPEAPALDDEPEPDVCARSARYEEGGRCRT